MERYARLAAGRGSPIPFKAFPLGGRWIAEATAKARRMRGRDMTNVTYKTTPHHRLRRSFPPRGSLEQSAYADIYGYTVPKRSYSLPRDLSTSLEMTGLSTVLFDFIMLFCKFGRSRLAHGGSPFAPALVSTSLEMTERWSITQGWRRDEGVPPYRGVGHIPSKYLPTGVPCRADEDRPYHALTNDIATS